MLDTSQPYSQKGISLFLSVLILTILLTLALGLSTILVSQTRILRGMGDSVQAFFAADSGIERALFEGGSVSGTFKNGAKYETQFLSRGPNCAGSYYCLKSKGIFRQTQRAIEITR